MRPEHHQKRFRNNHLANARDAVLHDYLQLRAERPENRSAAERHAQRGLKAMRLAPNLDVCRALLAGQHVPLDLLDNGWASRHHRRSA